MLLVFILVALSCQNICTSLCKWFIIQSLFPMLYWKKTIINIIKRSRCLRTPPLSTTSIWLEAVSCVILVILGTKETQRNVTCTNTINQACTQNQVIESYGLLGLLIHVSIYIYIPTWWFQPIWKIPISQNGNLPQVAVKINNLWNHHIDLHHWWSNQQ